jgi:hypothetical protein
MNTRFSVLALALSFACASSALTGCAVEGGSEEDVNEQDVSARALYTKCTAMSAALPRVKHKTIQFKKGWDGSINDTFSVDAERWEYKVAFTAKGLQGVRIGQGGDSVGSFVDVSSTVYGALPYSGKAAIIFVAQGRNFRVECAEGPLDTNVPVTAQVP